MWDARYITPAPSLKSSRTDHERFSQPLLLQARHASRLALRIVAFQADQRSPIRRDATCGLRLFNSVSISTMN